MITVEGLDLTFCGTWVKMSSEMELKEAMFVCEVLWSDVKCYEVLQSDKKWEDEWEDEWKRV